MKNDFEQRLKEELSFFTKSQPGRQVLEETFVTKTSLPRYHYIETMKTTFTVLVLILIVGVGALIYFGNKGQFSQVGSPTAGPQAENQTIPQTVTPQNVDSTLSSTDTELQQTMNQADQDLKGLDNNI